MKHRSLNEQPQKILVRAPNWIGDQVLAFPFFYYLRKAYPKAHITSVCVPWVKEMQFADLVNDVYVLSRPLKNSLLEKISVIEKDAQALKERGPWDLGFSLPNSLSAAWLMYRAQVKRRRGYRYEGRGFLLNEGLHWNDKQVIHRAQSYVDLLPKELIPGRSANEFWGVAPENELDEYISGELDEFRPNRSWPEHKPLDYPKKPYWVLAPGATADSRRWPTEYFVTLSETIYKETGWPGLIVGGPKEAPLADQLIKSSEAELYDVTAQGPVPVLSSIFKNAQVTVCNESGLAHVASLCGSSVQIVCGAADPRRTRPIGPGKVQVAINPVGCWPCEKNTCAQPPGLKFRCLIGLKTDQVWDEIRRELKI